MLREVEGLRRIAALAQAQAEAMERQLRTAEQRSQTLEATARSLVQQGRDKEAREAVQLKLQNDRLLGLLREQLAEAKKTAAEDCAACHRREAEVQQKLEEMRQLAALEVLNAQRRELEKRRRELGGETSVHVFEREEERIRAETYRLSALASMHSEPERVASHKVTQAVDEAAVDETIAAMKRDVASSAESAPR